MSSHARIAVVALVVLAGCSGTSVLGPNSCEGTITAKSATEVPENRTVLSYDAVADTEYIARTLQKANPDANRSGNIQVTASEMAQVEETYADLGAENKASIFVTYENTTMEVVQYCDL